MIRCQNRKILDATRGQPSTGVAPLDNKIASKLPGMGIRTRNVEARAHITLKNQSIKSAPVKKLVFAMELLCGAEKLWRYTLHSTCFIYTKNPSLHGRSGGDHPRHIWTLCTWKTKDNTDCKYPVMDWIGIVCLVIFVWNKRLKSGTKLSRMQSMLGKKDCAHLFNMYVCIRELV